MENTSNRRAFLLATASGVALATAGCLNEIQQMASDLNIADVESQTTVTGGIELIVAVENAGSSREDGVLAGEVDIQGSDTLTETRNISVGAESVNTFTLSFSPDVSDRVSSSQFSYDVWLD